MTSAEKTTPYVYPHENDQEVTDAVLAREASENPEEYGAMLPHIDAYLRRHDTEQGTDTFVTEMNGAIDAMQRDVAGRLAIRSESPDATQATDYLLVRELEEEVQANDHASEGTMLAPFVAGALEADGQRDASGTNPVAILEADGYQDTVTDAIAQLRAMDARLPGTDHRVSDVFEPLVQGFEPAKNERVLVGNPEMQSALNTIADADFLMQSEPAYQLMLERFGRAALEVDWEDIPRRDVAAFVVQLGHLDQTERAMYADKEDVPSGHQVALKTLAGIIPGEVLQDVYTSSETASVIRSILDSASASPGNTQLIVNVLAKVYGSRRDVAATPPGVDSVIDRLRDGDLQTEYAISIIEDRPDDLEVASIQAHDRSMITQAQDILENKMQLPHEFVRKYGVAISGRLLSPPDGSRELGFISGSKLAKRLNRVKACVDAVGPETIVRLHEELGLVNIDNYAPDDLRNLIKLLDNDPEYIEQLQAGDVAAVFTDAYGDHNGALSEAFDAYRRGSGRTLMFELGAPSDLYRRMIMLKRLGVRPSTLIVGAHGEPGRTLFGNAIHGRFVATASGAISPGIPGDTVLNLSEARLDRLASDEFMQESKGLDDGEDLAGRRRVIMNSCSSDVEFAKGIPSTAETVARVAARGDTDVYGASDIMYMGNQAGDVSFFGMADKTSKVPTVQIGRKVSVKNRDGFITRLKERFGGGGLYMMGERIDRRRNTALKIKRTKVNRIFTRNTAGSLDAAA